MYPQQNPDPVHPMFAFPWCHPSASRYPPPSASRAVRNVAKDRSFVVQGGAQVLGDTSPTGSVVGC